MAKRVGRFLPVLLTCLFLLGSLVSFAGALSPSNAPDYHKWEVKDVLARKDLSEQFPDGSFRIDLTSIQIVGIKQATYMLVWSRDELSATEQQAVKDAFPLVDPSKYTDFAFYHGTGLWDKPDFWKKGNSFGRYEVTKAGDVYYLTIGSTGSVSHFVFGFGTTTTTTSESTTTTSKPTTTTSEPTTTTSNPTTTTSEPTTTTSKPTTTTSEPTTTTSEPTTTTSKPTTTTSKPTTTTSEPTTTTSEPTTTTSEPTTTTSQPTTTTSKPTTTTSEPTTTTSEPTTTTSEPTTTTSEPTTTTSEPTTTTSEPTTTTSEPTTMTSESTTVTTVPDTEIIEEEDVPLVNPPQDSDTSGSPKTGNTALPWLFIGAAAVSLTVALLLNHKPAEEA